MPRTPRQVQPAFSLDYGWLEELLFSGSLPSIMLIHLSCRSDLANGIRTQFSHVDMPASQPLQYKVVLL
jgi:hypothetical protein